MNVSQRTVALAAAVWGLALALDAAYAQEPATTPAQEPTAIEKSAPAKATTTPLDESSMPKAQEPTPEPQAGADRAQAFAKSELNNVNVNRLAKFEDFDKNKDGSLAKDEVPANDQLALSFASYDKDSDSKISQQEFAQYKSGKPQLARAKASEPKQEPKSEQQ